MPEQLFQTYRQTLNSASHRHCDRPAHGFGAALLGWLLILLAALLLGVLLLCRLLSLIPLLLLLLGLPLGELLLDIRITLLDLALDLRENFDELLENPIIEDCDDLPLDNDEALEEDESLILLSDDRLEDRLLGDELLLVGRQQHQP